MAGKDPVRILQVFERGMVRGGAETWAMHVLRHIDRELFRMDFMVESAKPGDYDDEIRALGSEIIVCSDHHNPLSYARDFKRILRERGPYDVIHSQLHHVSGYALRLAHKAGVPVRIAHSHGDFTSYDAERGHAWRAYTNLMRRWIDLYATEGLAASRGAAADLFGADWRRDPRWRILYCGIDLEPFRQPVDKASVRAELGIPGNAFVAGHVGRFYEYKNHQFLVKIASEMSKREPMMRLLLVGEGPTLPAVKRQVAEAGLEEKVVFAGLRTDIPRLMLGAMDVFVLPSLYEGLPLVGLEAQAAGLPILLSDTVSEELDVVPSLIERLPLLKPPPVWAEKILQAREAGPPLDWSEALELMESSALNIDRGVRELEEIYAR